MGHMQRRIGKLQERPAPPALPALFEAALRHHQGGELDKAEELYRRLLAARPRHADGLHLLGVLAGQRGAYHRAAELIGKAISLDAGSASYHANLGLALSRLGRVKEATACYRRALALRPEAAEWLHSLGVALSQDRQAEEAIACFRRVLELRPDHPEAWSNLGAELGRQDRLEEAEDCCRRLLALRPDSGDAHYNLGVALLRQGRTGEAEDCCRRSIALQPGRPEAHYNLGLALALEKRHAEAEACFRAALALRPDYPEAHNSLGSGLRALGRPEEAIGCYREALRGRPDYAEALYNWGVVRGEQGHLAEAADCYRRAIALKPDYPEACNNLGNALADLGRPGEAMACYRKALADRPGYAEAHNNLGVALGDQGQLAAAAACYEQAVTCNPTFFTAHSNRLFTQNHFAGQPPEAMRRMAEAYGALLTERAAQPFRNWHGRTAGQPLRVGLVSGDFRNHPVGYFLEGPLRAADPQRVAFLAFPSSAEQDALTARLKPLFRGWHPIHGLDDVAAARLIHAQQVDVLIDLAGHTQHNRLPVFAWRPAPVQVTWLGYFATTGVAEIDYLIGDPNVTPAAEHGHFTETVWPLPEIYYCFSPPEAAVAVSSLPAKAKGHLTFGCFNNLAKLSDEVVAVWARVLRVAEGSRLLLKSRQLASPAAGDALRARFAAQGIAEERLLLEPPSLRADYLAAYHRVDIALDPFPYPGGATSAEALWMGVPVLTRRGDRFLSHAGETILRNAGLPGWIAQDNDDYVARAARFAADLDHLAALRGALRRQVLASPLFDAARFARHLEDALWGMWHRREAGLLPVAGG